MVHNAGASMSKTKDENQYTTVYYNQLFQTKDSN